MHSYYTKTFIHPSVSLSLSLSLSLHIFMIEQFKKGKHVPFKQQIFHDQLVKEITERIKNPDGEDSFIIICCTKTIQNLQPLKSISAN